MRHPIEPRKPRLGFAGVPKHWFAGEAVLTHMVNGVNLLFPWGERGFVRSVYHFLDRIDDPELRAAVKGFGGQEGRHARAHEDYFDTLRAQGYEIDRFLERFTAIMARLERAASPEQRLASTAACEHFTALMAEGAAAGEAPLELAHPRMRELLYWHAAEELEHKSVAYDVLQAIDPSYRTRVIGLAMATVTLAGFWMAATTMLLRQDGVGMIAASRRMRTLRRQRGARSVMTRIFARGIREYLRRDFHPDHNDNYHLAAELLARAEAAAAADKVAA